MVERYRALSGNDQYLYHTLDIALVLELHNLLDKFTNWSGLDAGQASKIVEPLRGTIIVCNAR